MGGRAKMRVIPPNINGWPVCMGQPVAVSSEIRPVVCTLSGRTRAASISVFFLIGNSCVYRIIEDTMESYLRGSYSSRYRELGFI